MAEAHAWTLQRLREMAGRLTEQAYLRASEAGAGEAEDAQRWMLVFDRMARGLRLTMALEARLARERRWDARELVDDEMVREAQGERHAPRWRRPASAEAEPRECDRERDDDGLAPDAPLAQRIDRLKTIIEGAGQMAPSVRYRFEDRALGRQRALRARLAGGEVPPDEPWDVLMPDDHEDGDEGDDDPPWRSSG